MFRFSGSANIAPLVSGPGDQAPILPDQICLAPCKTQGFFCQLLGQPWLFLP